MAKCILLFIILEYDSEFCKPAVVLAITLVRTAKLRCLARPRPAKILESARILTKILTPATAQRTTLEPTVKRNCLAAKMHRVRTVQLVSILMNQATLALAPRTIPAQIVKHHYPA